MDMDAVQDAATARIARIGRAASKAADDLTAEMNRILGTYAKRFGLTRDEAIRALNEPFDEDSRAYGYRRSRAEALRDAVEEQARRLADQVRRETKAQRAATAATSYERALDGLRERGAGLSFSTPDLDGLMHAIGTRWQGTSYSASIWANRDALAERLREQITSGFLSGRSDAKIAEDIRNEFGVGFRQAERLVRTETSYVCNRAEIEAYRAEGIERYEYLTAKDSRTCKLCSGLNGHTFAVADAEVGVNLPPMHPWCRCTVVAVVEEDSALDGMSREEAREWAQNGAPEDVQGWLKKARGLQKEANGATIAQTTSGTGNAGVIHVGQLDREIYKCVTPDITTDDVVITDERIMHIVSRHPIDAEQCVIAIKEAVECPDYIVFTGAPNTAFILKESKESGRLTRTIVRLHTSDDELGRKNSVITFQHVKEKEYKRILRNKRILYSRNGL